MIDEQCESYVCVVFLSIGICLLVLRMALICFFPNLHTSEDVFNALCHFSHDCLSTPTEYDIMGAIEVAWPWLLTVT